MNKQTTNDLDVKNANAAVEKAYTAIITEVISLLSQYPTEELRTYIQREGTDNSKSFYNPMIAISLRDTFGKRIVSFAKNFTVRMHIGGELDSLITRAIYRLTSVEATKINIEDRLEEYGFNINRFNEAVVYADTRENYKKQIVSPKQGV